MSAGSALFEPIRIGRLELRNRLVMSPMETGYATREGLPSPRTLAYYEARARGGVGLVTLGASSVDPRDREVPRSLHFGSDDVVAAHRELVRRVHAHGARIQPQLVHPGPDGLAPFLFGVPSIGPSVIPSYLTGVPCRELAAEEIPAVVALFRAAARRVGEAGYDGIELHAAHGYMLLGSFLTPWRNRRSDAYTGATAEGRIRFVVEVVRAIKDELGGDFPLTLRLSGHERVAGGRDLADSARIAPALVAAGVDAFHVSGGVIDRLTSQMVAGSDHPDAHNAAAAAAVRAAVDVPVIAVGRIHDPALAERLVREGSADLVAMARPLLADPDLPEKARTGRASEIRRCISCQHCIDSMETGTMRCAVNAFSGREGEWSAAPARHPRRVLVLGGGPAGLEVARLAARRGHAVSLHEATQRLGGALALAAEVRPANRPLLDFLLGEVDRLEIDLRLGSALSAQDVVARAPDVVVVATGGRRTFPRLPGDDLPHVRTLAALAGTETRSLAARGRAAVVGGGLAAVQLAEHLAQGGRRVALIDPGDAIAPEVGPKRRGEHMLRLDRLGVTVHCDARAERITRSGLVWRTRAGGERACEADVVLLAGEVAADTSLYDAVRDRVPEAHAVGDCTGPGLIHGATHAAARVACAL